MRAFRARIADHNIGVNTKRQELPPRAQYPGEVLERFLLGFPSGEISDELAGLLAGGLAGVALYPRNFRSLDELCRLTRAIRQAAAGPILIGIDQEGGTKFSLGEPFTPWTSPDELGRLGDAQAVEQIARAAGRELRAAGINLNFAPMLDLSTNPHSPVTSGRSFGDDATKVAEMGCAYLRGLQSEGVLACAKHFPGHGDAAIDPHLDLPRFEGTRERLTTQELVPFAAAIKSGVPLIMTAHILLPRIDPGAPASLSREVLESILRHQLGFDGVVLADDLGMGAIARHHKGGEAVVRSLQAGTDVAMLCHDWSAVGPALDAAARAICGKNSSNSGLIDARMTSQSHARMERLRRRLLEIENMPVPPLSVIGCAQHRALTKEIRERMTQGQP